MKSILVCQGHWGSQGLITILRNYISNPDSKLSLDEEKKSDILILSLGQNVESGEMYIVERRKKLKVKIEVVQYQIYIILVSALAS